MAKIILAKNYLSSAKACQYNCKCYKNIAVLKTIHQKLQKPWVFSPWVFFKMSKGKAWVNAASQQTLLLSLAPHPIQSFREVAWMLCQTITKLWPNLWVIVVLGAGLMLLRSKLFYCLRLPIQSNAWGNDLNATPCQTIAKIWSKLS